MKSQIWIVDFGSQVTQLVTKKMRKLGFYSEIRPLDEFSQRFEQEDERPLAIVLSGGPDSVEELTEDEWQKVQGFLLQTLEKIPVLGICFGMQIMARFYGVKVEKGSGQAEYGKASIKMKGKMLSFFKEESLVWMGHQDKVAHVPQGFETFWESEHGVLSGMYSSEKKVLGVQFHPEMEHSEDGDDFLSFFAHEMALLKKDWDGKNIEHTARECLDTFDGDHILCAFSGGVDSLVAATLVDKYMPGKVVCFFVDTGLCRPQDLRHIEELKKNLSYPIEVVSAEDIFLSELSGVTDPEEKRKVIGRLFIDVFDRKVHEYAESHNIHFTHLLQGTLYPDIIESHSPFGQSGKSVTIKSHHNVGGLPEKMHLKLLEPLKSFFKDEVRELGKFLDLKRDWIYRHPFPGPGLGVRILGEVTADRLVRLKKADDIFFEELKRFDLYDRIWQTGVIYLPIKTVGVKGDGRVYEDVIALRPVCSTDGMTADVPELPFSFLHQVSKRITNEVEGIVRVVLDLTSKPPGTIEWE